MGIMSIDGFLLDSTNGISKNSVQIVQSQRQKLLQPPIGIGAQWGREETGGKRIMVKGRVAGSNFAAFRTNWGALEAALMADGDLAFIYDADRELIVRPSKTIKQKAVAGGAKAVADFSFELAAAWPYWRSVIPVAKHVDHSGGAGITSFTLVNGGDAPAQWEVDITTTALAVDEWLELKNNTTGQILRFSGFGLTTVEKLVFSTARGYPEQASGAFPDDTFGIEVVDGVAFNLAAGNNQCELATSHSDWDLDFIFHDSFFSG